VDTVAERLGLKPETIRLWIGQRKVSSVKLGRRRLVPENEVERLIESNLTPARPER
jgi:excisionase family DNA binding protein